jgi:hypothetical protein
MSESLCKGWTVGGGLLVSGDVESFCSVTTMKVLDREQGDFSLLD